MHHHKHRQLKKGNSRRYEVESFKVHVWSFAPTLNLQHAFRWDRWHGYLPSVNSVPQRLPHVRLFWEDAAESAGDDLWMEKKRGMGSPQRERWVARS